MGENVWTTLQIETVGHRIIKPGTFNLHGEGMTPIAFQGLTAKVKVTRVLG